MKKLTELVEETLIIIPGLDRELTIMQITDSHLTESDDRDTSEVQQMAKGRSDLFESLLAKGTISTVDNFSKHIQLSKDLQADVVVFTGDIIDFPTPSNLGLIQHAFQSLDSPYLYTMGNHDWSFPHLPSDDAVRIEGYGLFKDMFTAMPDYQAKEVGGVILIAVDNSNYQLTQEQFDYIRGQAGKGKPCLLFMHIPLYLPTLEEDVCKVWSNPIMMGASNWTEEDLVQWQTRLPDESTLQFIDWLSHEESGKAIKGIFCGHVHFSHMDAIGNGSNQYVTAPGYQGGSRVIKLRGTVHATGKD